MVSITAMRRRRKTTFDDKIMYAVIGVVFTFLMIVLLYPLVYVVSASFSSGVALEGGRVVLWPVGFNLNGYRAAFSYRNVLSGYRNTILYTVAGTSINLVITLLTAYPLSRRDFPARKGFMIICAITMFFNGGLVPTYMLVVQLGLINTPWSILLPGAMSVFNMILVRTFIISSIPAELLDASRIDGCSDARYFIKIVLPLSKAVIAVVGLYYAVDHWNSYFNAMLYLHDEKLHPLQLVLRNVLVTLSDFTFNDISSAKEMVTMIGIVNLLKYSLIVVSSVPIIALYPFVQRYFVKGVMIGSIKG